MVWLYLYGYIAWYGFTFPLWVPEWWGIPGVDEEMISHTAVIRLLFFGGLYFLGRILFSQMNLKSTYLILIGILLAGIGESVYGLGQLYGVWRSHHPAFPITGSFFNPGPYSGWLALCFPVAVWVLYNHNKSSALYRVVKVISWCFLFLASGVLIVTMSRAAWLAAAGGSLIIFWGLIRRYFSNHKKIMKWALPLVSVLIVTGLAGMYFLKKDSAQGRLLIYKVSTEMIAEYPLFGVGWDRFQVMYPRHQAYYFDSGRGTETEASLAGYVEYPFNEVLGWTAEMGLVGLILIILIFGIVARRWTLLKKTGNIRPIHTLVLSVVIAWGIFSIFSYPSEVPVLALTGILSISALLTVLWNLTGFQKIGFKQIASIGIPIIIITSALYSLYWVHQNYSTAKTWISANANYQLARYTVANDIYQNQLWPALQNEGAYLQMAGKSLSMARQLYPSTKYLERDLYFSSDPVVLTTLGQDYTLLGKVNPEKYERAEFLLNMAKKMQPGHFFPRYLLIQLYQKTKQDEKLKEEAVGLLALEIKVPSEAVSEMRMAARKILDKTLLDIKISSTGNMKKE